MSERSGGCLCGKVRYTLTADPMAVALCHCRNCQITAGSAFSVVAVVPSDSLLITGEPSVYHDHGDSGGSVDRYFCGSCGSPIVSRGSNLDSQGIAALKAASLDNMDGIAPGVQVWCDSEQGWLAGLASVPRFARNPG